MIKWNEKIKTDYNGNEVDAVYVESRKKCILSMVLDMQEEEPLN